MNFNSLVTYTAALFCGCLAVFVYYKDSRSFVHRTFAAGMIALALEAALTGFSFRAASSIELIQWQRLRLIVTSILPGIWLLFSLTFARANYKETVSKMRWLLIAAFIIPLVLVTGFNKFLFLAEDSSYNMSSGWLLRLGWSGYFFYLIFLISAILILMNLERIFRSSTGSIRWQIKFMVLGIGAIFAFRIYSGGQALLFSSISSTLEIFNIGTTIISGVLITIGLARTRILKIDIYFSSTLIYNSLIVLIIGIYLLIVGGLAKAIRYFNGGFSLNIEALFIFLLLLGLTIVLLSEEVRQRIRELISRHFKLPHYDYRREWREFTKGTTSLVEIYHLSSAIVKMVAETFGVSSVSIWLFDELKGNFVLGGSTVFPKVQAIGLNLPRENSNEIISEIRCQSIPIDFSQSEARWIVKFKKANPEYFNEGRIIYCIPLAINENFLGLLTLNNRITGKTFTMEDFDLLKTIADQTAGNLLNLKLSEHLQEIKQMEAFQTMSAFMIHDLKNLASTLSLTVENLPIHFDNPGFRNDALQTIKQSVTKINSMCGHLSMLSQKIELKKVETDLNEMVTGSLSCLNGCNKISLIRELQPVPRLVIDPEQVQKVLTNLLLNANEAVGNGGEIRLATEQMDGWVILSVSDNGCGMSKEFMERSLFHPFKTTKKQGMGIGLFQSKMIVEAHQGRIEVKSEEGKGSTFKVFLPMAGK